MAWLETDRRTGYYKIGLRLGERKFKKSLQTKDPDDAAQTLGTVEQTLRAVERGWATIPPNVDVADFLLSAALVHLQLRRPRR